MESRPAAIPLVFQFKNHSRDLAHGIPIGNPLDGFAYSELITDLMQHVQGFLLHLIQHDSLPDGMT